MASVYALKPAFQRSLAPALDALERLGITANQVTLSAVAVSAVTGALVVAGTRAGHPETAVLVAPASLLRMALCALDGMLARRRGTESRAGAVLNEMGDLLSDVLMYLPLAWPAGVAWWSVALLVCAGLVAECAGILAQALGEKRAFHGPMGKSDRALWVSAGAVLVACGGPAAPWFCVLAALAAVTTWNRCRAAVGSAP